ncbi:aldo/keto reductase [Silvimonas iriomotensis]
MALVKEVGQCAGCPELCQISRACCVNHLQCTQLACHQGLVNDRPYAQYTIHPFPPVNKDKAWACVAAMRSIADKHATTVASIALAYLLAKPFVTSVITGAKRLAQLQENLSAVDLQLDAEDMATLDGVSKLEPEYPGWMIERTNPTRLPTGRQVLPGNSHQ